MGTAEVNVCIPFIKRAVVFVSLFMLVCMRIRRNHERKLMN